MKKRTLEFDVMSSLENLVEGESTVAEHAMLLARDHGLSFNEAVAILNKAIAEDPWFDEHPLS